MEILSVPMLRAAQEVGEVVTANFCLNVILQRMWEVYDGVTVDFRYVKDENDHRIGFKSSSTVTAKLESKVKK